MSSEDVATGEADRAYSAWAEVLELQLGVSAASAEKSHPVHRFRVLDYRRHDAGTLAIDLELMPNYPYKNTATTQEVSTIRVRIPLVDQDGAYILPGVMHMISAFLATGGISDKNIVERTADGVLVINWDY